MFRNVPRYSAMTRGQRGAPLRPRVGSGGGRRRRLAASAAPRALELQDREVGVADRVEQLLLGLAAEVAAVGGRREGAIGEAGVVLGGRVRADRARLWGQILSVLPVRPGCSASAPRSSGMDGAPRAFFLRRGALIPEHRGTTEKAWCSDRVIRPPRSVPVGRLRPRWTTV